jgi:nitronate monooxygenase
MDYRNTYLTQALGIEFPVIAAPMFLVSNVAMTVAALNNGITAAIPALNYRTEAELRAAVAEIRQATNKPFGFNLIVNKGNPKYRSQLDLLVDLKVDFIITSLGSPEEVINRCKPMGIRVFCDVVDERYASKVAGLGADAVIAVTSAAGGHAGSRTAEDLIPAIRKVCDIPVIGAGGVTCAADVQRMIDLGACGVSVGTVFIASHESPVSAEYKQAMVQHGAKDVVMTTKLSGTPCTVINTDYVKKVGTRQNWFEKLLSRNRKLRKYVKMLVYARGLKKLEKAAFGATYQTYWCAGPAIEHVHAVRPMAEIVGDITEGL